MLTSEYSEIIERNIFPMELW